VNLGGGGVELNDTHMLIVSADDVSLLADSVYVIERERENEIFIFFGR